MNIVFTPVLPYGELTAGVFNNTSGTVTVYLHFQTSVTGVAIDSLSVTNATVVAFSVVDSHTYSYSLKGGTYGLIIVYLDKNSVTSSGGQLNTTSNTLYFDYSPPLVLTVENRVFTPQIEVVLPFIPNSRISYRYNVYVDNTRPDCFIEGDAGYVTGIFRAYIRFTKHVKDFISSNVSITNAIISNFRKTSDYIYEFNVLPLGFGDITIKIEENAVSDTVGNSVTASNIFNRTLDLVPPYLTFYDGVSTDNNIIVPTDLLADTAGNEIIYTLASVPIRRYENSTTGVILLEFDTTFTNGDNDLINYVNTVQVVRFLVKSSEPILDFDLSKAIMVNCYVYSQEKLNEFDYLVSIAKTDVFADSSLKIYRGLFFDADGNRNIDSSTFLIS